MTDLNKVNFMSKTRFDNLAVTNDDELYIVETDVALDSEVVHNTGNETIAGIKTFSTNLTVTGETNLNNSVSITGITNVYNNMRCNSVISLTSQSSGQHFQFLNIGTTSGTNFYKDIAGVGTDNIRIGGVRFNHSETDIHKVTLYTADDTNTYATDLQICYDNTNEIGYISTNTQPAASNTTNDNIIPTTGWVNDPAKSTNVVHRSGNESIGGTKTFLATTFMQGSNDMSYAIKCINADNTAETQSVTTEANFRAVDNNGKIIGDTRFYRTSNGTSQAILLARNYANTSAELGNQGIISISVDNEGNIFTSAPTPPVTDNSTQIATTAYINTKIQLVNALPASPVTGVLYLIPET